MLVLLLPVSAALVLGCAYLVVSMVAPRTRVGRWLALWLAVWAEVVLSAEFLSLFDAITPLGFLTCHVAFGAAALVIWAWRGKPRMRLLTLPSRRRAVEALRAHPVLGIMLAALAGCALVNLVLAVAVPVTNADSLSYHLARVGYWIQHGSTDHFVTYNARQNSHPPNSEFGILSMMIFARADWAASLGQYAAYFACLAAIYFVARRLGASNPASLFAALLVGTMSEMVLQMTIPKNDLIVASFLACSIAFLLCGLDARAKTGEFLGGDEGALGLVWSAIAVGLAVGTKYTALLFLPGLAVSGMVWTLMSRSVKRIRRGALWAGCCLVSVVLFGSLSYGRNLVNYGQLTGPEDCTHQLRVNPLTLRATASNLARYGYYLCDFSGLLPRRLAVGLTALRARLAPPMYGALRIPLNAPDVTSRPGMFPVDEETGRFDERLSLGESVAWFGPIAFFVGVPLVLVHLVWSPWRRRWIPFTLAMMAVLYWLVQCSVLRYDPWRGRFFVTAVVVSGPLLACTYLRGPWRFVNHATTWLLVIVGLSTTLVATIANPPKPLYPDLVAFRLRESGRWRPETWALEATLDRHFGRGIGLGLLTLPTEAEWPLFGRGLHRRLVHFEVNPVYVTDAFAEMSVDVAVIRRSTPFERVPPVLGERPVPFALRSGLPMTEGDRATAHWWSFVVADSEPTDRFFPARDWEPSEELWFGPDQLFVPTRLLPGGTVRLHIEPGRVVEEGPLVFEVYAGDRLVDTFELSAPGDAERAVPWPGGRDAKGSLLRITVKTRHDGLSDALEGATDVYRLLELPRFLPAVADRSGQSPCGSAHP